MNSAEAREWGRLFTEGLAQGLEMGEGMLRFSQALPSSLYGIPVREDEALRPGQGMLIRQHHGGDELVLHPTVRNAMMLAAHMGDIDRMNDPRVMIAASIRWQQDVIERAAKRAEQRLELVILQQDQRRLQREQDAEWARRLNGMAMFHRGGGPHRWLRHRLRATATCWRCKLVITEEVAHRLGIELGEDYDSGRPLGTLSVMSDDGEWHEVRGVRNVSFSREDGAR